MTFRGSLEDLSLVDALQLLYVARKTGLIHISLDAQQALLDAVRIVDERNRNDAVLGAHLYARVGRPANADVLLLPLRTEERTAALIHGDFGDRQSVSAHLDSVRILVDCGHGIRPGSGAPACGAEAAGTEWKE